MNGRTTAILLLILIALGSYVFWSGDSADQAASDLPTPIVQQTVPVLTLDPAAVQALNITGASGQRVSLAQGQAGWTITAPVPSPADMGRVTTVITQLATLEATRVITPADQNLAPYGLNNPSYTVTLLGASGELARLHLGGSNLNNTATYVQRNNEPIIYLVHNFTLDTLRTWTTTPPVPPTPMETATPVPTAAPPITATTQLSPTVQPTVVPTAQATAAPATATTTSNTTVITPVVITPDVIAPQQMTPTP
jgi:hypothetical protein